MGCCTVLGVGGEGSRQRCQPCSLSSVSFVLSDWRPALNLAALDCAEETNNAVCREFDIPGFPTVRVCDQEGRGDLGGSTAGACCPLLCATLASARLLSSVGSSQASGLDLFKSQPLEHCSWMS